MGCLSKGFPCLVSRGSFQCHCLCYWFQGSMERVWYGPPPQQCRPTRVWARQTNTTYERLKLKKNLNTYKCIKKQNENTFKMAQRSPRAHCVRTLGGCCCRNPPRASSPRGQRLLIEAGASRAAYRALFPQTTPTHLPSSAALENTRPEGKAAPEVPASTLPPCFPREPGLRPSLGRPSNGACFPGPRRAPRGVVCKPLAPPAAPGTSASRGAPPLELAFP